MSKIKSQTKDPENYRNLSVPFESQDAANEALSKFHEELGVIRKKYKIPDLLIVTKGSMKMDDGEIGEFVNHSSYGNSLTQLPMAAYAYGQLQKDHEEIISKLIAGKTK